MKVLLKITLEVNSYEDKKEFPISELEKTAREAVDEALNHAMNRGFNHPLSNDVSIGVEAVDIVPQGGQYVLASEDDANDNTNLTADTWEDAAIEALEQLGWNIYLVSDEDNHCVDPKDDEDLADENED